MRSLGNVEDEHIQSALVALVIMAKGFEEFKNGNDFRNKPGKHWVEIMDTTRPQRDCRSSRMGKKYLVD